MIRSSVSGLAIGSRVKAILWNNPADRVSRNRQYAAADDGGALPKQRYFQDSDRGLQRHIDVGVRRGPGVRTAGTAGLGASSKCLIDNGLDGARATAAFGATAEAAIDLLSASGEVFC